VGRQARGGVGAGEELRGGAMLAALQVDHCPLQEHVFRMLLNRHLLKYALTCRGAVDKCVCVCMYVCYVCYVCVCIYVCYVCVCVWFVRVYMCVMFVMCVSIYMLWPTASLSARFSYLINEALGHVCIPRGRCGPMCVCVCVYTCLCVCMCVCVCIGASALRRRSLLN
jgi:hypothetical protein